MMLWLSVIVYLLQMCLSSDGQFCEISPPSQIEPTYDVCKYNSYYRESQQNTSIRQPKSHYGCDSATQLKLNYRILNSTLGKMEVTFTPFTLCNLSVYEIKLSVNERISEDTCNSSETTYYDTTKHSSKKVSVKTSEPDGNSEEPCNENVTVIFNDVFTGCYMLKIQTEYRSIIKVKILKMYIATDYKKKNVTDEPSYTLEYFKNSTDDVGVLRCNIVHSVVSEAQLFRFTLLKTCSHVIAEMFVNTSGLTDESDIKCIDKGLHNNNSCEYKDGMLACVLYNIPSGYYCAEIEFIDDRCGNPSVWADGDLDPCFWPFQEFWLNETNKYNGPICGIVPPISSSHMTFTVVLIVVSIIVLLGLLAFVAYRQVSTPVLFIPIDKTKLKPLYVKERPTVLLLYARDCDEFMNVMAEFTYILKSSLKCQVFDCWDPIQYEKVAQSPTDWVLSLIADKSVCITLVSTPCSCLLEKSLLTDKKFQYRQPDAFDKLFIFALRHLTETTILDSYNRIFVVRLDKNAQNNNNSLTYLNPLTVHSLPVHLDKLMLGLHRVDPMEYTVSILDLPEVKNFSSSVESFQNFVQENPYYLDFLLEEAEPLLCDKMK